MPTSTAEEKILKEVTKLPGVTTRPHRFGGTEFRLGARELGHLHGDYQATIHFSVDLRKRLVVEGRAEPHHILPESGWRTLRFHSPDDVDRAISLFKMSYDLASQKAPSASLKTKRLNPRILRQARPDPRSIE